MVSEIMCIGFLRDYPSYDKGFGHRIVLKSQEFYCDCDWKPLFEYHNLQ